MGYSKQAAKGVGWMSSLRIVTRILAYLKIAILARLLTPEHFGLFGIASIVLAFLEILTSTGINVFFIQEEGKLKDFINSAWIISIIRGVAISILIFVSSFFIPSFFNSPNSGYLIMLISIAPLIKGFGNPAIISLRKDLLFKKEFLLRSFLFFVESLIVIVFAFYFRNPSSFVFGMIGSSFLEVVLSFTLFKQKPCFKFEKSKIKTIVNRGKWVTSSNIFSYLFENLDDVFVGKILNTCSLGIYQVAYRISTLPITEVREAITNVAFPVYSKISKDKDRLKRAYLKTLFPVFALSLTLGFLVFLFSKEIVFLLLGNTWISVVPILRVLAIFGVIRSIVLSSVPVFNSVKKQEYASYVSFLSAVVMILCIVPFINKFGILGAGYSAILGTIVSIPLVMVFLIKSFKK